MVRNTGVTGANIFISASIVLAYFKIFIKNTLSLHGSMVPFNNQSLDTATSGAGLYFQHTFVALTVHDNTSMPNFHF